MLLSGIRHDLEDAPDEQDSDEQRGDSFVHVVVLPLYERNLGHEGRNDCVNIGVRLESKLFGALG